MNKIKVVELKHELARIAQEICNELDGKAVSIDINTYTSVDLSGSKSTHVADVSISFTEEM